MNNKLLENTLLALTTSITALATIAMLYFIETRLAAIVTDWRVTSMRYHNGEVYITGELAKDTRLSQEIRSGDRFVVTALHQCHGLWLQATEYGDIDTEQVMRIIQARE